MANVSLSFGEYNGVVFLPSLAIARMRIKKIVPLCLLVLLGCQKKEGLTFESVYYTGEQCTQCPKVDITLPKALDKDKVAASIDNALKEEVIFLLSFDDEIEAASIEEAIKSFSNGYTELRELYPEESTLWEAKIDANLSYEDREILTIEMDSYIFTGGAHGYTSKRLLNFDRIKGTELENWQLFKDSPEFQKFAEGKFRAQEKIPREQPINSTGFMFEDDIFHLPENIGLTKEGLTLLYNQYEVASYADGPIELVLPYKEVKKYLAAKIKS